MVSLSLLTLVTFHSFRGLEISSHLSELTRLGTDGAGCSVAFQLLWVLSAPLLTLLSHPFRTGVF